MQVALHSKNLSAATMPVIADVLHALHQRQATLFISPSMQASLQARQDQLPPMKPFTAIRDFAHINLVISLGGDRTLLEAVQYVGAFETPILGINLGRMGFLATVAPEDALAALAQFLSREIHFGPSYTSTILDTKNCTTNHSLRPE